MDFNGYLMSGYTVAARIENGTVIPVCSALLPLWLTERNDLEGWLKSRAIDRHRTNSRVLKKLLRLTDSGDLAAVLRAHGATITDHYWIRSDQETELIYPDIRFTSDRFAEVALTGSFSSYDRTLSEAELASGTPELTNTGSYEKCWKLEEGSWWLYKSENRLERFSELFICELGKALGFPMAEYLPSGNYIKTKDFTGGTLNYEPAEALVGEEEDYVYNYDKLTKLDPLLGKQYLDLLFMDALCFNMDRHTKNYGVLRDRNTGHILRMAPNFDNNIALISRGYGSDACHTSPLLIDLFRELLVKRGLNYRVPAPDPGTVQLLAQEVLPSEEIRRDYVSDFILSRWETLFAACSS